MARYAVLIGDVVGSRQLARRAKFQERFSQRIQELNQDLEAFLLRPIVLLRGDEIQALFCRPEGAALLVSDLAETLFPVRLNYGLGWGELTTAVFPAVSQIDGVCFHRAREALELAQKTGVWLVARGFDPPHDDVLSSLFQLMDVARSRWTERQNQLAHAARTALQKDVAKRLGISRSVVSESLSAASFATVREAEKAAGAYLASFGASDRGDCGT